WASCPSLEDSMLRRILSAASVLPIALACGCAAETGDGQDSAAAPQEHATGVSQSAVLINPPGYNPPGYNPLNPALNPPGYNPPATAGLALGSSRTAPLATPPRDHPPAHPPLNPPGSTPPGYGGFGGYG